MIDKLVGYGLYLIGPVIERDDDEAHFVIVFGGARGFTIDYCVVPADHDPHESRAYMVRWAQSRAIDGAEVFDNEHSLLMRAVEIWPSRKTQRALAEFEESMALAERLNAAGITPDDILH